MITSGLVVQNHGKGIFPSSRKSSKMYIRPHVDGYDSPIPEFSRPFDEKFTSTVNYHKVFGKGVTPDEKLYYLQNDMLQNMRRINAMPLNKRTKKLKALADEGGTLMDKFLFLERFKNEGVEGSEMDGISEWFAGVVRQPMLSEGRQSTAAGMDVDKRSILQSHHSTESFEALQRKQLQEPALAKLLDDTEVDDLLPKLKSVIPPPQPPPPGMLVEEEETPPPGMLVEEEDNDEEMVTDPPMRNIFAEIQKGHILKPASQRELGEKMSGPPSIHTQLMQSIRDGLNLNALANRKSMVTKKAAERPTLITEALNKYFKNAGNEADDGEDDISEWGE